MVGAKPRGRPARRKYRVIVALFPHEWDELRMEAQARDITGGELIGAILSQYITEMPPAEDAPLPERPPGDEGDELQ